VRATVILPVQGMPSHVSGISQILYIRLRNGRYTMSTLSCESCITCINFIENDSPTPDEFQAFVICQERHTKAEELQKFIQAERFNREDFEDFFGWVAQDSSDKTAQKRLREQEMRALLKVQAQALVDGVDVAVDGVDAAAAVAVAVDGVDSAALEASTRECAGPREEG
jgi:hypothetical protein